MLHDVVPQLLALLRLTVVVLALIYHPLHAVLVGKHVFAIPAHLTSHLIDGIPSRLNGIGGRSEWIPALGSL